MVYLVPAFIFVPLVELLILLKTGEYIGTMNTIAVVLLTGVAGAYLAKSQGLFILRRIREDIQMGIMPSDKLFDGFLVLAGGILLLTPGFLTDIAGFCALIPFTRELIKKWLKGRLVDRLKLQRFR